MRRARLSALAALFGVLLLDGCGRTPMQAPAQGAPATPSSALNHELLRGNGAEPDSLDPQKARTISAQTILRDLYECLTSLDKDASVAPGVAREWNVTPDGLAYTFHLRPEARWSNGDPVTAEDFVASLRRLVDPATASQYAQVVDVIANATEIIGGKQPPQALGVAAPDHSTVVITLVHPAPYLPDLMAHPSTCPIHRPSLAAHPDSFSRPGVMISNGAFVLKEWVPGSHVLAIRNARYWNDASTRLDAVRYLHLADENAEFLRYRAGSLHVTAVVPRNQIDFVKSSLSEELHVSPQLNTYYYGFNLDRAFLAQDARVRVALSMVIDRERLTRSVLRMGELPAYGWVPPRIFNYTSQSFEYRNMPLEERIARARTLYAEAGYSPARPLKIGLSYSTGDIHSKLAIAIASMWKEALGVDVHLDAIEHRALLQQIDRRDVDLFVSGWIGDYNDAYTFLQYLRSGFAINLPHYANPAYDRLLDAAAATPDAEQRRTLLESAERTMLKDHPLLPIFFYVNKHLVKPQVAGWYDNVMNIVYSKDLSLLPESRVARAPDSAGQPTVN